MEEYKALDGQYTGPDCSQISQKTYSLVEPCGRGRRSLCPSGKFLDGRLRTIPSSMDWRHSLVEWPPFPDANSNTYQSFLSYEQAVLQWKLKMTHYIRETRLPSVMGKSYYRPLPRGRSSSIVEKKERTDSCTSDSDNTRTDSIGSKDGSEEGSTEDEKVKEGEGEDKETPKGKEGEEEETVQVESEDSDEEVVLDHDPWDSQLVPPLPTPSLHDSYDSFRDSLLAWLRICANLETDRGPVIEKYPPHASQLLNLIPVLKCFAGKKGTYNISTESQQRSDNGSLLQLTGMAINSRRSTHGRTFKGIFNDMYQVYYWGMRVAHLYQGPLGNENLSLVDPLYPPTVVQHQSTRRLATDVTKYLMWTSEHPPIPKERDSLPSPQRSPTTSPSLPSPSVSPGSESGEYEYSPEFDNLDAEEEQKKRENWLRESSDSHKSVQTFIDQFLNKMVAWKAVWIHNSSPTHSISRSFFEEDPLDLPRLVKEEKERSQLLTDLTSQIRINDRYYPSLNYSKEIQAATLALLSNSRHDSVEAEKGTSQFRTLANAKEIVGVTLAPFVSNSEGLEAVRVACLQPVSQDHFQEIVSGECLPDSHIRYSELLLDPITSLTFPQILSFFRDTKGKDIHLKLAFIVSQVLQSGKGKEVLDSLISKRNIPSLYATAYAMSLLYEEEELDVFPFVPSTFDLVSNLLNSMVPAFEMFLMYYYLKVISIPCTKNPYTYVTVHSSIQDSLDGLATQLGWDLETQVDFNDRHLFRYLGHRSSAISSFMLLMVITLCRIQNGAVQRWLTSTELSIVAQLRALAYSKYSHAQFAARRIFDVFQEVPSLREHLYSVYAVGNSVFQDLMDPPKSCSRETSLLSLIVSDILIQSLYECCLKSNSPPSSPGHLRYYHQLVPIFRTLFLDIKSTLTHPKSTSTATLETISHIFVHLANYFHRHQLLQVDQDVKIKRTPKKASSANSVFATSEGEELRKDLDLHARLMLFGLQLTPKDILDMVTLIHDSSGPVKVNLLSALHFILLDKTCFQVLSKEANFYSKLLLWCKDGSDPLFNKKAWILLCKLIKTHQGLMEELAKNKILGQFLDVVVTGPPKAVILHGLRCIRKLFQMASKGSTRPRNNSRGKFLISSPSSPSSPRTPAHSPAISPANSPLSASEKIMWKGLEKDVKTFASLFIQRHHFIKIHMIYKSGIGSGGAIFHELAQLYQAIATEPACQKLYKDTIKNSAYKQGLTEITNAFSGKP